MSQRFWLTHMRIGFGVFLAEGLVVATYLAITPRGPHRAVLWAMVSAWLAFASINLAITPRVAASRRRATFSVTWTILSTVAVAGVAQLDGGVRSSLVLLLFLPIGYAAWAFTPNAAAACGCASLAAAGYIVTTTRPAGSTPQSALMLFGVLAGASVLSVSAARNRARRERHEAMLARRIAELAATDELTGCAVRRVFHDRFADEITRAHRQGHPLTLMMVDVDDFKAVNDSYGHVVGDNVLAAVGETLRAEVRSFDVVGRIGGDEFAVVLPETHPDAALAVAERIRNALPARSEVPVTISIGISGLGPSAVTMEQMTDEADLALYHVKRGGRDGVFVRYPGPVAGPHEPPPTVLRVPIE